nr:immunoglobulin light chain junction region [Mus musculus]NSM03105.1 immunoglobulin light chain junction region [Mus musculus]NSM03252.1 immunoglobulin light chain junction region [Mus musculus]NSM03357.1 immunoglobulin light chain junction region [Mus musculus]NSM03573.1 immunoglobulin light chain junction region [Mus musculus]
CALWYSTHYVF